MNLPPGISDKAEFTSKMSTESFQHLETGQRLYYGLNPIDPTQMMLLL